MGAYTLNIFSTYGAYSIKKKNKYATALYDLHYFYVEVDIIQQAIISIAFVHLKRWI